jgi:hypothetical protein
MNSLVNQSVLPENITAVINKGGRIVTLSVGIGINVVVIFSRLSNE